MSNLVKSVFLIILCLILCIPSLWGNESSKNYTLEELTREYEESLDVYLKERFETCYLLGRLYEKIEDYSQACKWYEAAFRLKKDKETARRIINIYRKEGMLDSLLEKGKLGQFLSMIKICPKILSRSEGLLLTKIFFKLEKIEEGWYCIKETLQTSFKKENQWTNECLIGDVLDILCKVGQNDLAEERFLWDIAQGKAKELKYLRLGKFLEKKGFYPLALREYKKAMVLNPGNEEANNLFFRLQQKGQFDSLGGKRFRWRLPISYVHYGMPRIIDDTIYFYQGLRGKEEIVALSLKDGSVKWKFKPFVPPPIIERGKKFHWEWLLEEIGATPDIILAIFCKMKCENGGEGSERHLFGLDPETGDLKWEKRFQQVKFSQSLDGLIAFSSDTPSVTNIGVMEINSGKKKWNYRLEGEIRGWPIIYKNKVYQATSKGLLIALNLEDGKPVWPPKKIADKISYEIEHPLFLSKGKIFVQGGENHLLCLDAFNGSVLWKIKAEGRITSNPVASFRSLYFIIENRYLYALDVRKGKFRWRKEVEFNTSPHRLSISQDTLYISSQQITPEDSSLLYVFNPKSGEDRWRYLLHSDFPVLTKGNIVFVPCLGNDWKIHGGLYALNNKVESQKLYKLVLHLGGRKKKGLSLDLLELLIGEIDPGFSQAYPLFLKYSLQANEIEKAARYAEYFSRYVSQELPKSSKNLLKEIFEKAKKSGLGEETFLAALALANIGDDYSLTYLENIFNEGNNWKRSKIVFSLSKVRKESLFPVLLNVVRKRKKSPSVYVPESRLQRSILSIDKEFLKRGIPIFLEAREDSDPEVRKLVEAILAKLQKRY
jgi:outer membrane protein assembly factor BamB/TPR repeat protein